MKRIPLKVARIGNSRGVRIPAITLARYRIGDSVIMEETADGILLRPRRESGPKLSWEATAGAMAASTEDWSDWDVALANGLDLLEWSEPAVRRVAECAPDYSPPRPKRARR